MDFWSDAVAVVITVIAHKLHCCSSSGGKSRSDSREGRESIVRLLLHNGTDPNVPGDFGRTALHCAVNPYQYCNSDIITSLLNAGANVNAVNDEGENIVCYAGQSVIDISCHSHSTEEIRTRGVQ